MYAARTGLILGFHGTDRSVVNKVLKGADLSFNNNTYDWLGHGIYFWDNSPSRALEWAKELSKKPNSQIKKTCSNRRYFRFRLLFGSPRL